MLDNRSAAMITALVGPTYFRTVTADGSVAYRRHVPPYEYPFAIVATHDALYSVPTHWLVRIPQEDYYRAITCPPPTPVGS